MNPILTACSFIQTGKNYTQQYVAQCYDCFTNPTEVVCLNCLHSCHLGHHVSEVKLSNAFCDCGYYKKCKNLQNQPIIQPLIDEINEIKSDPMQPWLWMHHPPSTEFPNLFPFGRQPLVQEMMHQDPIYRHEINEPALNNSIKTIQPSNVTNIFGSNLLKLYDGQVLFSPYSILSALLPILYGSFGNTRKELEIIYGKFHQDYLIKPFIELFNTINNSNVVKTCNFFISVNPHKVKDSFAKEMKQISSIESIDLGNVDGKFKQLNDYIDNYTNHMIKNPLSSDLINADLAYIIVNVIYFKANWKHKFNKSLTQNDHFNIPTGSRVIDFMSQNDIKHNYFENEAYQLLEMNYDNDNFSFGMLLPKNTFESPKINNSELRIAINNLSPTKLEKVKIPKFTHRNKFEMNNTIKKFGVKDIFDKDKSDFTNMTDEKELYVDKIIHEAVIIVDEDGTEASAVTVAIANCKCISLSKPSFIANHPFTYYIRHKPSNVILFIGRYVGN